MSDANVEAGQALDAEICRLVFGFQVEAVPLVSGALAYGVWGQNPKRPGEVRAPFPYSTEIQHAWKVAEALHHLGWHARLTTPFEVGELYFCGFTPIGTSGWNGRPDHEAGAETMPLAICRAALMAVAAGINGSLSEEAKA